jgi:predicted Rossmann fold flavoprotein
MKDFFDVAVIGGGPAGLMAASVAAQSGAKVVVIERNEVLGKKLLLTGGTRCNVTNLLMTKERLVDLFGPNGKFLYSALSAFGVAETIQYFKENGLAIKEEAKGCVFTARDNAQEVVKFLDTILYKQKATVFFNCSVKEIIVNQENDFSIKSNLAEIQTRKVIIATGGLSFPSTGSTGDGLAWAKSFGHTIIAPRPALAPVTVAENWIESLQGLSFPDASIAIWSQQKKIKTFTGDLLFTNKGLTGPVIHNASRLIGELQANGQVVATIDCLPNESAEILDRRLQIELANNYQIRNYLETFIAKRLADVVLQVAGVMPGKISNSIAKLERKAIVRVLKELPCTVTSVAGFDRAMITAGGVSLKEIDAKTMESKKVKNLYFVGEVLDLDGPSGGYNLQVCWTTGYAAGRAAAEKN